MSPSTAIARREASRYARWSGGTTTAWGQSTRARAIGIAACTPKARAS
jgi:hypothetical protein